MTDGGIRRADPERRRLHGRERRLALAPEWVASYRGKRSNMVRRYRKAFAVDWECAIAELEALGIVHDMDYLAELRKSIAAQHRSDRKAIPIERWEFETHHGIKSSSDEHFAYIAGYTAARYPFGVTWEEWERHRESDPPQ